MAPVIVAKDLFKCYAGFAPVLRGVNLEVVPGEMVAIMGPSGCGKSTMLHVLGMLHAPDSGSLEILGQDVLTFDREQTAAFRRGNMGFVMQASNLFDHSTVFENVEFPLIYEQVPPQERWERVIRALELVRLSARVHYRSNRLSGGEQQRVAIARAMVNNPRILLADEPTGALDAKTSRLIMNNFRTLCHTGGVAMVMVTHDPKMADFCDSIYTLEEGLLRCQRHNLPEVSADGSQELLRGRSPVVRGAMVAERFPEISGQCTMDEAHRMHTAGLLARIYALRSNSLLGNPEGYALPLAVRRIGMFSVLSALARLFRLTGEEGARLRRLRHSLPGKGRWGRRWWNHLRAFCAGIALAGWGREEGIEFFLRRRGARPGHGRLGGLAPAGRALCLCRARRRCGAARAGLVRHGDGRRLCALRYGSHLRPPARDAAAAGGQTGGIARSPDAHSVGRGAGIHRLRRRQRR
jgi:ABC-type lipoprotein export system ATPase subunit